MNAVTCQSTRRSCFRRFEGTRIASPDLSPFVPFVPLCSYSNPELEQKLMKATKWETSEPMVGYRMGERPPGRGHAQSLLTPPPVTVSSRGSISTENIERRTPSLTRQVSGEGTSLG